MRPQLPDYGVYLQWPEPGEDWIHPEDRSVVEAIIPSDRVFCRKSFDGEYYHLDYGDLQFRVLPSLWQVIQGEGFHIGDRVEILSRNDLNVPGIGVITEVRYAQEQQRILYTVLQREYAIPNRFLAEDLVNHTLYRKLDSPRTEHPAQRMTLNEDIDWLKLE